MLEEVAQLPPPSIEELFRAEPGSGVTVVGACPAGDALTGTALALLTSDGVQHCLWPSRLSAASAPAPEVTPISGLSLGAVTISCMLFISPP